MNKSVVYAVLGLILICLVGVVVYNKTLNKNNVDVSEIESIEKEIESKKEQEKQSSNNSTEELSEVKTDVVAKFEKLFDDYNLDIIDKYEMKLDSFNNLTNQDKLDLALEYLLYVKYNYDENFSIDANSLNDEYFSKVFNNYINYSKNDGICHGEDDYHCHVLYDSNTNKFVYNKDALGHGMYVVKEFSKKLIDFKTVGDNYELTYVKLFGISDPDSDENALYYNRYNFNEKADKTYKSLSLDNYNDFPKYKYVVKLVGNNIRLVSYEYVK